MNNGGDNTNSGGIHVGNVGGSVIFSAGGDNVGGDKTTTTAKGFADEEQRAQFQTQIDQLREALRAMKGSPRIRN